MYDAVREALKKAKETQMFPDALWIVIPKDQDPEEFLRELKPALKHEHGHYVWHD